MFNLFRKKSLAVHSPVSGRFKKGSDIQDPVFGQGMMGETFAIVPDDSKIYAPFDAEIVTVFPSKHAIGLKVNAIEVILHVGIDTVHLKGEGFTCFVEPGQIVKQGDLLLEVDFPLIKEKGYQTDVILALNQISKATYQNVEQVNHKTVILHVE